MSSLALPTAYSRYGYTAVSFLGADRWNNLPAVCRQARSPAEFATSVKLTLGYPVRRPRSVGSPLV